MAIPYRSVLSSNSRHARLNLTLNLGHWTMYCIHPVPTYLYLVLPVVLYEYSTSTGSSSLNPSSSASRSWQGSLDTPHCPAALDVFVVIRATAVYLDIRFRPDQPKTWYLDFPHITYIRSSSSCLRQQICTTASQLWVWALRERQFNKWRKLYQLITRLSCWLPLPSYSGYG